MAKNLKSNLEKIFDMGIFRKSKIKIVNVSAQSYAETLDGALDETDLAGQDFALVIPKMDAPCILVNEKRKKVDTYFPRAFKKKLSNYNRKDAKKIIGQYRETLNTLRRNNYKVKLIETLGPWDDENEN